MSRFFRQLFFLFAASHLLMASVVFADDLRFTVSHVEDGDTVVLSDGRWVRYIGINAPETGREDQKAEPLAEEAKAANRLLVLGKKIRIELDEERQDQYGRLLGYVFLEDGTFVNARLIELGYAFCLPRERSARHATEFLRIQREAMSLKKGIWTESLRRVGGYPGNYRSKRFHLETCPLGRKTAKENRVVFKTHWDAFWEGFAPCRECRPWP